MNPLAKRVQGRLGSSDDDALHSWLDLTERIGARSVAELHSLLDGGSREQRLDAIALLGLVGDRRWSARRLLPLLELPDETVRWTAATALCNLGSSANRAVLARLLGAHPEPEVRKVAAYLLGFMAGVIRHSEVDALVAKVLDQDEDIDVRCYAAEALGHMLGGHSHARRAIPGLTGSLNDPLPEIRFWAAFALGSVGRSDQIEALERLTADEALVPGWWSVGREAADAIEHIEVRYSRR
jgi:HEAT repeat protein